MTFTADGVSERKRVAMEGTKMVEYVRIVSQIADTLVGSNRNCKFEKSNAVGRSWVSPMMICESVAL